LAATAIIAPPSAALAIAPADPHWKVLSRADALGELSSEFLAFESLTFEFLVFEVRVVEFWVVEFLGVRVAMVSLLIEFCGLTPERQEPFRASSHASSQHLTWRAGGRPSVNKPMQNTPS